jgi:hypothetical protein
LVASLRWLFFPFILTGSFGVFVLELSPIHSLFPPFMVAGDIV